MANRAVGGELGFAERGGEDAEELVIGHGDDDETIGTGIGVEGCGDGVPIAGAVRCGAGGMDGGVRRLHREHDVEHRDVDVGTFAGGLAVEGALEMPKAAKTPAETSAMDSPTRVGESSGKPVDDMRPLRAWMTVS